MEEKLQDKIKELAKEQDNTEKNKIQPIWFYQDNSGKKQ